MIQRERPMAHKTAPALFGQSGVVRIQIDPQSSAPSITSGGPSALTCWADISGNEVKACCHTESGDWEICITYEAGKPKNKDVQRDLQLVAAGRHIPTTTALARALQQAGAAARGRKPTNTTVDDVVIVTRPAQAKPKHKPGSCWTESGCSGSCAQACCKGADGGTLCITIYWPPSNGVDPGYGELLSTLIARLEPAARRADRALRLRGDFLHAPLDNAEVSAVLAEMGTRSEAEQAIARSLIEIRWGIE